MHFRPETGNITFLISSMCQLIQFTGLGSELLASFYSPFLMSSAKVILFCNKSFCACDFYPDIIMTPDVP